MKSKINLLNCLKSALVKKITSFMGLITVLFLLICFPAEAEQEGDKDPASISGGVILQEYPTEVYKAPEEMAVYSELPDSINLSASNYFPPIREIKIRIYCI